MNAFSLRTRQVKQLNSRPSKTYEVLPLTLVLLLMGTLGSCNDPLPRQMDNYYKLDTVISFAAGGNADPFKVAGWAHPERYYTWTEGPIARVRMRVGETDRPLGMRVRLIGMTKPPHLPLQPVLVHVNGQKVAEWHVADRVDFNAVIPVQNVGPSGLLAISFEVPLAISPKALGINDDERIVGVACFELEISKTIDITDIWPANPQRLNQK